MITNGTDKLDYITKVKGILAKEPGLSVKELAERLKANRQYMAGVLKVLEEFGEVTHRQVGPARIYYAVDDSKEESNGAK
ncbi:hypothetical protein ASJ33_04200 [Dehalococcoides mccartyi]|uniref:hypothetical protein n=1 Tax=Dehalococcoides mccartyi TaxID=61435 RepID=UPI00090C94D2|nr:hypothetical protein [Dehalococcoides mccartyi]APH12405.1 hypothetical protein ASJ33_04200 [Dehalococcoides mccartyi]